MRSCRPAPSSCDTDGGTAISTPTSTRITTDHTALPTATPASVVAPWRPASTVSTKVINTDDSCPATIGAASSSVRRTSPAKR